ncbi:MAG TPA: SBBP repeat-containing protein [Candidatus Limnocylindrales bacterium]|nr:SBBP repeat-containing protein [Candidatus Limnocylindrales bacterium]
MSSARILPALTLFLAACFGFAVAQQQKTAPVTFPLAFEVNRGQTAPQVHYLARSREGMLFFTEDGVTVSVPQTGVVRMVFENSLTPLISGEDKLIARSNYLSREPGKSISNVENFNAVRYSKLYPGIDVRFYGRERHLEHDFILSPGADANRISLRLDGIGRARLLADGSVELMLGQRKLYESQPIAWQNVKGKKVAVAADWKIVGENRLGVTLGSYDHNLPVTIDPVLAYSTHLGGTTGEDLDLQTTFPADTSIRHIGLDSSRNVYVGGSTSATDFPTTAGAFDRTPNSQGIFHSDSTTQSGFVSKFDKTGRILIYSTFIRDFVDAMAVEPSGHVYTSEAQFDEDPGPNFGSDEGFWLDKISLDGSHLLFSRLFAQTTSSASNCQAFSSSFPSGLAVDNSGHAWVVGNTANPCLPASSGAFQKTMPNTNSTGFVVKFNTNVAPSSSVVFSTYLGGNNLDGAQAVTIDSSGNAYVAGTTQSSNFPHTAAFGTDTSTAVFVTKLNATGSGLIFSTLLRGGGSGQGIFNGAGGIAVDASHNVYVGGITTSTTFPTTSGAFDRTFGGGTCNTFGSGPCLDSFVSKISSGGGTLIYSTYLGGSGSDGISGLAINSAGMAFVTGSTTSTDFPTTPNAFKRTLPAGATNAFVTALQPNGSSLYYSTLLGGSHNTAAGAIAVDPAFNAWVGGNTSDADYPVTADAFQPGLKGNSDGFIAKVVIAADLKVTLSSNVSSVAHNGNVILLGNVANLGPDGSDNVVFTEPLAAGYQFQGVSTNATSCSKPAAGATSGTITCIKTRLENGQTFFVNVFVKAIAASGHNITSTAKVSAKTQDLKTTNNTATRTVHVN